MKTNTRIALMLSPVIAFVMFGTGAAVLLATPQLAGELDLLLPLWAIASIAVTPELAISLAPSLRSLRYHGVLPS